MPGELNLIQERETEREREYSKATQSQAALIPIGAKAKIRKTI